jgi:hypothetical protein
MAEVKNESREDLELDIVWEKRAKKILLICTAICSGLGLIGGAVQGIAMEEGMLSVVAFVVAYGIWLGPGLGGAISLIPMHRYLQKEARNRGEEASKFTAISNLIEFVFILFVGPLGLLVRILRMNSRIKKFEKRLSALGQ